MKIRKKEDIGRHFGIGEEATRTSAMNEAITMLDSFNQKQEQLQIDVERNPDQREKYRKSFVDLLAKTKGHFLLSLIQAKQGSPEEEIYRQLDHYFGLYLNAAEHLNSHPDLSTIPFE